MKCLHDDNDKTKGTGLFLRTVKCIKLEWRPLDWICGFWSTEWLFIGGLSETSAHSKHSACLVTSKSRNTTCLMSIQYSKSEQQNTHYCESEWRLRENSRFGCGKEQKCKETAHDIMFVSLFYFILQSSLSEKDNLFLFHIDLFFIKVITILKELSNIRSSCCRQHWQQRWLEFWNPTALLPSRPLSFWHLIGKGLFHLEQAFVVEGIVEAFRTWVAQCQKS